MGNSITKESPLPKYYQLKEILEAQIKSDGSDAGSKFFSERDLTIRYKVSRATVRQALEALERDNILTREQGKGTFVMERRKKTYNIGLVGHLPLEAYESDPGYLGVSIIIHAIMEELGGEESFLKSIATKAPADANLFSDMLREKNLDGLIFLSKGHISEELSAEHIPHVLVDDRLVGTASVLGDEKKGAYLATRHLLSQGHQSIATINGPLTSTFEGFRLRYEGYKKALEEAGLSVDEKLTRESGKTSELQFEGGYEMTKSLLSGNQHFTALFAASDPRALGAIKAIREQGLKIPQDIAIVGLDDFPTAVTSRPPLTTVSKSRYEMGRRAVRILLRQLDDKAEGKEWVPVCEVIEPKLIIRESCGSNSKTKRGTP